MQTLSEFNVKDFAFTDKQIMLENQKFYLCNGDLVSWEGESILVFSPLTLPSGGRIQLGSYPALTEKESLEILDAAVNAYPSWSTQSVLARISCVETFLTEMRLCRSKVVDTMMIEIGKNQKDSEKEFDRTVEYIRDTIKALKDLDYASAQIRCEEGVFAQIKRAPLGVTLCMGPFNYPLNESLTTIIPALLMGNVVIFKPPKFGVLLFKSLLKAFQKAFPAGVVNSVYGDGPKVISPLMASGKIDALAFIGTSKVADILRKQHPKPHRLRCILGLEAKNVAIILDSARTDAVDECVSGALSFNGQRCTGLKLFFVESGIYELFVHSVSEAVNRLSYGLPWDNPALTQLPEDKKVEYLKGLVEDAVSKGAKIANRSGMLYTETFFYPIVLRDVTKEMRIFHEEQFGPIIPIVKMAKIGDAIDAIVNSNYGQQVSLFYDESYSRTVPYIIDRLSTQVSRINLNSQCQRGPDAYPFTGRKDSAEGTLSITDALRVFSIRAMVAFKDTDANKTLVKGILNGGESNFLTKSFVF